MSSEMHIKNFKLALALVSVYSLGACKSQIGEPPSEPACPHNNAQLILFLNQLRSVIDAVKSDIHYLEEGPNRLAAAALAEKLIEEQIAIATDDALRDLLGTVADYESLKTKLAKMPFSTALRMRSHLVLAYRRSMVDLAYPGALSRPAIIKVISEDLGVAIPERASSDR